MKKNSLPGELRPEYRLDYEKAQRNRFAPDMPAEPHRLSPSEETDLLEAMDGGDSPGEFVDGDDLLDELRSHRP